MCGRFTNNAKPKEVEKEFNAKVSDDKLFAPRYSIAPTPTTAAVLGSKGEKIIEGLRWGFIPFWAKDELIGSQ